MGKSANNHTEVLVAVGILVGLFALAIFCLMCYLRRTRGIFRRGRCCNRTRRRIRRLIRRRQDGTDEGSFDDESSGQRQTQSFETLDELVFFEAPDDDGAIGFLTSRNNYDGDDNRPKTMEQIFPDLLGMGTDNDHDNDVEADFPNATGRNGNELREPLL